MLKIDSATAANAATLASVTPSTGLIVLVLGIGIVYLLSLLLKNNKLTEAIAEKMDQGDETARLVKEIREGQIVSNSERKAQGLRITAIEGRLDKLERLVGRETP